MQQLWKSRMSGKNHTFMKGDHTRKAMYSKVCQWVLSSWFKIPEVMIIRVFQKSEIIKNDENITDGDPPSSDVIINHDNHSNDELGGSTNSDIEGYLSPELLQLFHSDTESEVFNKFSVG